MANLVGVRVPTYKRPVLLERALRSLIQQTHADWRAVVLDDSPEREGESVCRAIADDRIDYVPNPTNMGISANLDGAFSLHADDESSFVCVLEDDNYYLSDHLTDSIAILDRSGCDVLLRDHLIETGGERDGPGDLSAATQYGGQYSEGPIDQLRFFAALFYSIGATNAGLFWRAHKGLDFSTLAYVDDVVWQERLRTLCLDRPVYMAMRPTIVWRSNGSNSWRTSPRGVGWYLNSARWATLERKIYKALHSHLMCLGADRFIWDPPAGDLSPDRERVFHRVGIAVPRTRSHIKFLDLASLTFKRFAAQVVGARENTRCDISFDARGRLAARAQLIIPLH